MTRLAFTLQTDTLTSTSANPVGAPDHVAIRRTMTGSADSLTLALGGRADVRIGEAVALSLGHDGDDALVFTGRISTIARTVADLRVQALGEADRLLSLRRGGTYESQTVGAIVRDLAGQADIAVGTVDDGPLLHTYYLSQGRSVHAQLFDLARALGYEMYTSRSGSLEFRALGSAAILGSGLDVGEDGLRAVSRDRARHRFGENVLDAERASVAPSWGAIRVGGESPTSSLGDSTSHWLTINDTDYAGTAGSGRQRSFVDAWARTQDLAQRVAEGRLIAFNRRADTIDLTTPGQPTLELGDPVTTAGFVAADLNRAGYVRTIEHRFATDRGFTTRWSAALDAGS